LRTTDHDKESEHPRTEFEALHSDLLDRLTDLGHALVGRLLARWVHSGPFPGGARTIILAVDPFALG
jgi:hypothetical protein